MDNPKKSSFVSQAAILAAAGILARFMGFLYRVPLTNMIGDEGNGIYSSAYYIYTFLLIMSSAGLPVAISKMVSERLAFQDYAEAHRIFSVSLKASAFAGLVFSVILGVFAEPISLLIRSPNSYYAILTLSPTIFIVSIMSVYRGYFQGMGHTVPTACSQVVEQLFNAIFSVYLAWLLMGNFEQQPAMGAAGGTAGTGIGAFFGLLFILFTYRLAKPKIKKKIRRQEKIKGIYSSNKQIIAVLLKTALPIIAGTAIFSMTNLIDMVMVKGILIDSGLTEVRAEELYGMLSGKFTVLITLPISISTALATAAMPNIAASFALREKRQVKRKINVSLRLTMIISFPAAIGLAVLGNQILLMLFPNSPAGGDLLTFGAVSVIFLSLAQITTGMLQGINRVKVPAVAAFVGATIKIPLNLILISQPNINVIGAVLSTTACYAVASIIDLIVLKRAIKIKYDLLNIIVKPMVSSLFMGLACYVAYYTLFMLVPSNTLAVFFAIVVGVLAYFGFMILFKGIKREDISTIPMGSKVLQRLEGLGFSFE